MEYSTHDFRQAKSLLAAHPAWAQLSQVIAGISREDVVATQEAMVETLATRGKKPPKGGQSAINLLFRERLEALGWEKEPRLFGTAASLRGWKMDFYKDRLGVEVSFNHAEAMAWTLIRLNMAGESHVVTAEHKIDIGIAIVADSSLKSWSRMDSTVGTFDHFKDWLDVMRPVMPIPILLVGLSADGWEPTDVFPGTSKGR